VRWFPNVAGNTTYAQRQERIFPGPKGRRLVQMHRLIMGFPEGFVDHINGDGLDNRRANLRLATRSQNRANSRPRGRSGLKGVYGMPGQRWQAWGGVDSTKVYLGTFDDPNHAAAAYDRWAIVAHGEFARLNFPQGADV